LAFAILTDKRLFGVSPKNALLLMLVIPAIQATVYWLLLNVPRASLNAATRTQNASVNASNQLSPDSGEDTNPLLSSPNNRVNSPITTQSNLRRIKVYF
jgi:hypothetical protein